MTLDIIKFPSFVRSLLVVIFTSLLMPYSAGSVNASEQDKTQALPRILVLGDSLSAAYGIEQSQGWVSLLAQKLSEYPYAYQIVNASISGETTQGGLQRLADLLKKHQPKLVLVALGANDGLRGLDLRMMQHNLQAMISAIKSAKSGVLLIGIRLPPNYGPQYTQRFHQIYVDLASSNKIPLVDFLLERVATNSELMQSDGLHPTAEAQPMLLNNVWKELKSQLNID